MPKVLTSAQLATRASAEIAFAWVVHLEIVQFGRTAGRTTRMRAAKRRAYALLRRAIRKGLSLDEAKRLFETGPPDPEFGKAEW